MKINEYNKSNNLSSNLDAKDNSEASVTIIMVINNKDKLLKNCIYLIENTAYKNYKILIIDIGTEKTSKSICLKGSNIKVEIVSYNARYDHLYPYAFNEIIKKVNSKYILFLDDFTKPLEPNWLSSIVTAKGRVGSIFEFSNGNVKVIAKSKTKGDNKSQRKPKVLMIGHNLNLEGAPFSQFELTKGLLARGNLDIEVYCPKDGKLRDYYKSIGVKVATFGNILKNVDNNIKYDLAINFFSKWIKNNNYDVVYANTLLSFYGIDAARRAGVPSVWNIRESIAYKDRFNYLPDEIRYKGVEAFKCPCSIIFVSEATKILYEDLNFNKKFKVINNGLKTDSIKSFCKNFNVKDSKEALGIDNDKKMVLIVGTVCERKGQIDFAKAAIKYVEQGNNDTYFYIVGGRVSPYLTKIVEAINNSKAKHFIKLIMETNDVYKYFRAADLFVCCSYNESYPRVILEAMAFELPIIATSVFGIPEQVKENVNAFLYEPGDIKTLTMHLECLLKDDNTRAKLGKNSLNVFKNIISYEEMVKAYEKELVDALNSNGHSND